MLAKQVAVAINLYLSLICVVVATMALLDLTSIEISRLNSLGQHPQKNYFGLASRSELAFVAAFASGA